MLEVKHPNQFPVKNHYAILSFGAENKYYVFFKKEEWVNYAAKLFQSGTPFVAFRASNKERVSEKRVLHVADTPVPINNEENLISDVGNYFVDADRVKIEKDKTDRLPPLR